MRSLLQPLQSYVARLTRDNHIISKTNLLPIPQPKLLSEFTFVKDLEDQDISHYVYYSRNQTTGEYYFLKDIITDKRINIASPEHARVLAEKEILAGQIALSLQGEGHVPITGLAIGKDKQSAQRHYVYSREIEHYTSLKTIGDHLFDNDKLFYVNKDGHTCVTLNEKPRAGLPINGRIECTIVRRFTGEGDPNNKNAGVVLKGKNRGNIANIDFDSSFQSLTTETPEQLAFGIPGSIIPAFNVNPNVVHTIAKRLEVKANTYRKIAGIDPKELSQYLKDGFSEESKFHFPYMVNDIHDGMMETHEKYCKTYDLIATKSKEEGLNR